MLPEREPYDDGDVYLFYSLCWRLQDLFRNGDCGLWCGYLIDVVVGAECDCVTPASNYIWVGGKGEGGAMCRWGGKKRKEKKMAYRRYCRKQFIHKFHTLIYYFPYFFYFFFKFPPLFLGIIFCYLFLSFFVLFGWSFKSTTEKKDQINKKTRQRKTEGKKKLERGEKRDSR